jgi:hypothetical protein
MRYGVTITAPIVTLIWLAVPGTPSLAQEQTNQISIVYEEPKKADYRPIYDRLKQRKVLETLQQFLSPLKLPRKLTVKTGECGGNPFVPYTPGGPVTICYEFVALVEQAQPPGRIGAIGPQLVTRDMAVVGPFVEEALHDVALGVFDMLEVPVWGRAEDAADYVAAFVMLQFGSDVARKTVFGTAWFLNVLDIALRNSSNTMSNVNYLDAVRPTVRQRYYNILCIAVGSDPIGFSVLLAFNRTPTISDLPLERECTKSEEYQQVKDAFTRTILNPYVDPGLLKQVQSTQWLKDD